MSGQEIGVCLERTEGRKDWERWDKDHLKVTDGKKFFTLGNYIQSVHRETMIPPW